MPNEYKEDFFNLLKRKRATGHQFIKEHVEVINGEPFRYVSFNMDIDFLSCAARLGKKKAKHVMRENQASKPRKPADIVKSCTQGVLAEMFVHILLAERYGLNVLRYDLERETFKYLPEEYDLKIITDDAEFTVGVRSSNLKSFSVEKFVKEDVILGPYGNRVKPTDELSDFQFRPVYIPSFPPFIQKGEEYYYSQNMIDGDVKLIITGVATREEFNEHMYEQSLGQEDTVYLVVDADLIGDVDVMDMKLNEILK